jgi:hypothetical protein
VSICAAIATRSCSSAVRCGRCGGPLCGLASGAGLGGLGARLRHAALGGPDRTRRHLDREARVVVFGNRAHGELLGRLGRGAGLPGGRAHRRNHLGHGFRLRRQRGVRLAQRVELRCDAGDFLKVFFFFFFCCKFSV